MENKEPQSDSWQPGQIVSLYDMIQKFKVAALVGEMSFLRTVQRSLDNGRSLPEDKHIMMRAIIMRLKRVLAKFDMGAIDEEYRDFLSGVKHASTREIRDDLRNIEKIIMHELKSAKCYVMPSDAEKHISPQLHSKIQGGVKDTFSLIEAHKCLAFGRNTACVFHCLCVLEQLFPRVVRRMRGMGIQFDVGESLPDNWKNAINFLNKRIGNVEQQDKKGVAKRKKLQPISEFADYMMAVKNAWRNDTMHARGQFSEDVASDILEKTESFIKYLVTNKAIARR